MFEKKNKIASYNGVEEMAFSRARGSNKLDQDNWDTIDVFWNNRWHYNFHMGLKLDNLSTNFDKRSNNPNEVHINLVITSNCKVLDQINDEQTHSCCLYQTKFPIEKERSNPSSGMNWWNTWLMKISKTIQLTQKKIETLVPLTRLEIAFQ